MPTRTTGDRRRGRVRRLCFPFLLLLLVSAGGPVLGGDDDHSAPGWIPPATEEDTPADDPSGERAGTDAWPAHAGAEDDSVLITYRITSGNAVGLTVYNNGLFGNNFNSRRPSMEYPLGSNIDHLPRGGIWVGGVTVEGDTLVTTATVDGRVGDVDITSELLPLPNTGVEERSILRMPGFGMSLETFIPTLG